MKINVSADRGWLSKQLLLSVVLVILGFVFFIGHFKVLTLLAAAAVILLLLTSDTSRLLRWSALFLLAYVVFSGLTIFWAISGKFYLREYSKIFFAAFLFLLILLKGKEEPGFGRRVLSVLAGTSALLGLISVEAASTGLFSRLLGSLPGYQGIYIGFESGTRLTGVFGNANTLSSILAFGVFFSLALLCGAEERKEKLVYGIYLGINAFALLLCFSMGALFCFLVSVVLYLIFAGPGRSATLVRMLEAAIPTAILGFLAFPFFDMEGAAKCLPLLLLAVNAAVICLLEVKLADRAVSPLENHPRLAVGILAAILLLGVIFVSSAYHLSGPYTFGDNVRRSAYPEAGAHTLQIEADGDVTVSIVSQDQAQTMMHTETKLYDGPASGAAFTVPENSRVCYFTFSAAPGTTLRSASVDGTEVIRLDYTLLPGSIANRLQGLWANQNFIQRTVFFQDGMKLFRMSPVAGNGVGSFETGLTSVQQFHYETKYTHNHYIQVLLEDGVIGFVFYVAALVSMAVVLLKKRKLAEDASFRWLYPAFLAAFVMAATHSAVEVSLSHNFFLWFTYAVFGLIALLLEQPIAVKTADVPAKSSGKKGKGSKKKAKIQQKKSPLAAVLRVAGIALAAVFALTIAGNLISSSLMQRQVSSTEAALRNLEQAAKVDLYEKNDAKLSYVYLVGKDGLTDYLDKANDYAAQLMQVHSNSIPKYLISYYLQTGQYEDAIRAAKAGASYSVSDPETWDTCISMLRQALIDNPATPLLTEGDSLIPALLEYADTWKQRNETAMESLPLAESSIEFFRIVEQLGDCGGDRDKIMAVLAS